MGNHMEISIFEAGGLNEFLEGGSKPFKVSIWKVPITSISFLALLHPVEMLTKSRVQRPEELAANSLCKGSHQEDLSCSYFTKPPHTNRQPQRTGRQVQVVQVYFSNTNETYKSSAFLSSPMDQTTVKFHFWDGKGLRRLDMLGSCSWSLVEETYEHTTWTRPILNLYPITTSSSLTLNGHPLPKKDSIWNRGGGSTYREKWNLLKAHKFSYFIQKHSHRRQLN